MSHLWVAKLELLKSNYLMVLKLFVWLNHVMKKKNKQTNTDLPVYTLQGSKKL